uniref:Glyceraldehyde 3-phosphate dehydrogenase catalytic domain-containing protein n=1 Tax=Zea mays TaxID=4577 RepID=A0A804RIL5_MAIZE
MTMGREAPQTVLRPRCHSQHHAHVYRRRQGHRIGAPNLKGKLNAIALRVPTLNVSVVDLIVQVSKKTLVEELDARFRFVLAAHSVLDLCAAPGGWVRLAVNHAPDGAFVICVDLVPIRPIRGVDSVAGD